MPQDVLQVVKKTGLLFFPMHSTTNRTHFQPSSEQMGSLNVCFLSSVCLAAAPATTPASDKMLDLSEEVISTSMATGLSPVDTSLVLEYLQVL